MGLAVTSPAAGSGHVVRALIVLEMLAGVLAGGCHQRAPDSGAPSVLVVVFDTLRADAVSAYGAVAGTTPHVDALAATGLRYTRAYAPAPWTTPSHVSLFTGLGPEHHRIGMSERITAPQELVMLAERLRDAGYETVAFVENPLIGEPFGMNQGFERFSARTIDQLLAESSKPGSSEFDVGRALDAWVKSRRDERPFFLFVNLFEPHEPYRVRETNRFLSPGTTPADAARVLQSPTRICDSAPSTEESAVLRGLYLGDVAAADSTFGDIYRRVSAAAGTRPLVTVVTADHGEHIGERRLVDHQYTLADVALHIPLVVHGLQGIAPAVIDTPVILTDVAASVLEWAGSGGASETDAVPLPLTSTAAGRKRDFLSTYIDRQPPEDWPLDELPGDSADAKRANCGPEDRVFGEMASLIRYPLKLIWYARYSPQLYDLEQDPHEQTDLANQQTAIANQLRAVIVARIKESNVFIATTRGVVDERAREALRALGYTD